MPKKMKKGWSEKDLRVLRDWQKLSVSKRCTVAELARRVRRARKTVSDLLKKRLRKQITKQRTKQFLNKSVPVFKRTQEHKILSGRPKWQEFFAEQQTLLSRKGELRTAVFAASHSSILVDVVRATSTLNHRGTPTFNVEVEDRI